VDLQTLNPAHSNLPLEVIIPEVPRPRGIEPQLLLKQVLNTVPYLASLNLKGPHYQYLKVLEPLFEGANWEHFSWSQYFELCVAAHFTTVATFVPTDVDNHIRFKLWDSAPDAEALLQMIPVVLKAYHWDTTPLSTRWVHSPSGHLLEGHKGEWFSIAAAAYGASRFKFPRHAQELLALIHQEISHEERVIQELLDAKDKLGLLRASVLVAHNLGDLVRVMEIWGLPNLLSERLNTPTLELAGKINRDLMAVENSRHFALREPRALRKNREFLLPLGPFFDDWGKQLALHPDLTPEDLSSIAEALIQGWLRLKGPVGYSRALAGLETHAPGGIRNLLKALPSRVAKLWTSGALRQLCDVSQARFEAQWARKCDYFLAS